MNTENTLSFKRIRILALGLLVAVAFTSSAHRAHAANACEMVFAPAAEIQKPRSTRDIVRGMLEEVPQIPAFLKKTSHGDIPVILMTAQTLPLLEPLMEVSMGTQIQQQPGYKNDHGLLRVGPHIIDVDLPGHRSYGEINRTGLSWKEIETYLDRRFQNEANLYNIIEVGYVLAPEELATAMYYQAVRRAAIIRVPFTFGGAQNDLNQPNMLSTGEHCFLFCKGDSVAAHVREIKKKMISMGVANPDEFMKQAEIRSFLASARELMVDWASYGAYDVNWKTVNSTEFARSLDPVLPSHLDANAKGVLTNWIVGLDASAGYLALLKTLGTTNDYAYADMNSPRASFILMYGKSTDAAKFRDATFEAHGVFSHWNADSQRPLQYKAK